MWILLIGLVVLFAGEVAYVCCLASGIAAKREEEMLDLLKLTEAREELARHQRIAIGMRPPVEAYEGQGYAARKAYYDRWFDEQLNVEGWQRRVDELEVQREVNEIEEVTT